MSTELEQENTLAEDAAVLEMSEADLDQEIEYEDTTRDINIPPTPPPAGLYQIRWKANPNKPDGGITWKHGPKAGWFLQLYLLGLVQADGQEFHEYMVSDQMNSIPRRGTSDIAHFLNCCENPIPNRISRAALKNAVVETVSQEPVSYAFLEWRASVKRGGEWKNIANKMSDFPKLDDGTYQPWMEVPDDEGEKEKIYASAYIIRHIPPQDIPAST